MERSFFHYTNAYLMISCAKRYWPRWIYSTNSLFYLKTCHQSKYTEIPAVNNASERKLFCVVTDVLERINVVSAWGDVYNEYCSRNWGFTEPTLQYCDWRSSFVAASLHHYSKNTMLRTIYFSISFCIVRRNNLYIVTNIMFTQL